MALSLYIDAQNIGASEICIEISGSATLRDLKHRAAEQLGIEPDMINLHCEGDVDVTVMEKKIANTSLVDNDVLQLRPSKKFEAKQKLEQIGYTATADDLNKVLSDKEEKDVLDIVQTMIDYDKDIVHAKGGYAASTPLAEASRQGLPEVVGLLLDNGAEVDHKDKYDTTALMQAASCGKEDVIKVLQAKGADPNLARDDGTVPLHKAACLGYTAIAELLMANGAHVDLRNRGGGTALHWASGRGHYATVEVLLAHGASTTIKDKNGKAPIDYARDLGHTAVVDLLDDRRKRQKIA
eukprot:TRINITY_DN21321_c0_g1_i2.p1 TRINITY_DN21321_c0_g1~~TRINITY_DN21321_c0_g1_i2.p1  ORF type:complete len:296 (+),score=69.02 TRINITY_DN21321_c0_g1_i2:520-1407(+)